MAYDRIYGPVTFATLPAASATNSGQIWLVSDAIGDVFLRSNGSTWRVLGQAIDSLGNVVGLTGPSGGVIAQMPIGIPSGLDWLSDTLNGIDIYTDFVKRPTIFFDPNSRASITGLGTLKSPYTTQSELQTVLSGNMAGQVLGMRRGTVLRVTGTSGLNFVANGVAGNPLTICPYGDAQALPIITGGTIVTTWTLVDAGANIWSYALPTESDCWQSDVRLWKKAWNTNAVTTLTTAGYSTYHTGTLYIRPYNGENPNLGQVEVSVCDTVFQARYSDIAASGYIHIAGLHTRKSRINCFSVERAAAGASITTCDDISVVGCHSDGSGRDDAAGGGDDAFKLYGPKDSVRMTGVYFAGNYANDSANNAFEFSCCSGAIAERNICSDIWGNGIELFQSNDSLQLRYNLLDYLRGAVGRVGTGPGGQGIRFGNFDESTAANDATNAKNHDNSAYFNLITLPYGRGLMAEGGTGHEFYQNTVYDDPAITRPGLSTAAQGWMTDGTAAVGFINISNNLFYWKNDPASRRYPSLWRINHNPHGAAASVPSGDYNIYFDWSTGNNDCAFVYNGAQQISVTQMKADMAGYSLDQHSVVTSKNTTGGTLTQTALAFNETTKRCGPSSAATGAGATTLTGIGNVYQDGRPYVAASATIGGLPGT